MNRHTPAKVVTTRLNEQRNTGLSQAVEGVDPPDNLPIYRLLTGKDDLDFCKKVSKTLSLGYQLYGSPSVTFNGSDVIAAQAVIWPNRSPYQPNREDETPF